MIAMPIEDEKGLMRHLLLQETFDSFLITEGMITTFVTYTIDGQLHPDFYDEEVADELKHQKFTCWREVRNLCYQMIRGKRTPKAFKFVFQLPAEEMDKLLCQSNLDCSREDVFGLYLNCQYEKGKMIVTTGTSLRFFTLDKSLDRLWDEYVMAFFKEKKIT